MGRKNSSHKIGSEPGSDEILLFTEMRWWRLELWAAGGAWILRQGVREETVLHG